MDVFTISDVATVAGYEESTIRDWLKAAVLKPSVRPPSGRGREMLFSFDDAVAAGLCGSLRRQGVPISVLVKVGQELQRIDVDLAEKYLVVSEQGVVFVDDASAFLERKPDIYTVVDFRAAIDKFRKLVAAEKAKNAKSN